MFNTEMKQKWEKELESLSVAYTKLLSVINEFGLDHTGTPSHEAMNTLLIILRERALNLRERISG